MNDIAEGQVELQQLLVVNEELIAYMKPTLEQREVLKCSLIRIANIALQMHDLIKEN